MDWQQQLFLYSMISMFLIFKIISLYMRERRLNLPPSPPGSLPIVGHLHLMPKTQTHRALHHFSQKHGPIISLRFGSRLAVVVSSPSLAQECLTKNDRVLANRPRTVVSKYFGYNNTTIVFAPFGDHWRNLRRLCDAEIFSPTRLNSFASIRQNEVHRVLREVYQMSSSHGNYFAKINLHLEFTELNFNNMTRILADKRYFGDDMKDDEEAKQFRKIIRESLEMSGPWIGDFIPLLPWLGFNGVEKELAWRRKKCDIFMQELIEEKRQGRSSKTSTMVDNLLLLQQSQPERYTDEIIRGLVHSLIVAGTDAPAAPSEWAMSLLLNHPEVMQKAREELDTKVGHDRLVEDHDLSKLNYLHCIILETLRLFPALPTLLPHEASQDCKIGGYHIPKGTMVMTNVWAIHNDPEVWEDPSSFRPERFENVKVETHKYLPFGLGRRYCPASGLAHRMIGLALASMIQCFDWERVKPEMIDLAEGHGITMPKAEPLEAMCRPRPAMEKVLQELVMISNA